jgi:hypothetical protein
MLSIRRIPFVVAVTTTSGGTMRYALLICTDENAMLAVSPDEASASLAKYTAWQEDMGKRGALLGGERLRPTTDATCVQVRNGEVVTSDGPFAETKEQMGGFYLVECKDLDEAIEAASKIPAAQIGTIEVRPIWEM